MKRKIDVYQMVTDRVIELLEQGTAPWQRPWKGANSQPCNARTGHKYRGINPFLLHAVQLSEGYSDHRWLTFKQAKEAGGHIIKGSSSTLVTFWRWIEVEDKGKDTSSNGPNNKRRIPCLKYFRVFNMSQTENIDESKLKASPDTYTPTQWEAIESAEAIAEDYLASSNLADRITHGGNRAYYSPTTDSLQLPDRDRFDLSSEYYSTLFHELTHSTGHSSRLDRFPSSSSFGSDPYAREELIAELGSAFLAGHSGIHAHTLNNSAAYLHGWLRVLKSDSRLIPSAAAAAQKASDLILGQQWDDNSAQAQAQTAEHDAKQPVIV